MRSRNPSGQGHWRAIRPGVEGALTITCGTPSAQVTRARQYLRILATSVSGGAGTSPRQGLAPSGLQPGAVRTHPGNRSKFRLVWPILLIMSTAATPVPLSEAKARLSELARRVRQQHERITLTRNGEPEAVLLSVDDLDGLEMTLEILGDTDAVTRISESLAALERGEPGADLAAVRQDLARRRVTGT